MEKAVITATAEELDRLGFTTVKPQQVIHVLKSGLFFSKVQIHGQVMMMLNSLFTKINEPKLNIEHTPSFFDTHTQFC